MYFLSIVFLLGVVIFSTSPLLSEVKIPELSGRVIDQVGVLNQNQVNALEEKLKNLESQKGSQLAILVIPTTDGESIEQFSLRVVEEWKLGRKKVDDGILLLVVKNDRKMRIEVGYGLESALPDVICKRIISEQMRPSFKAGNYYEGIGKATDSIIKRVNGEELPKPDSEPAQESDSIGDTLGGIATIAFIIVVFGSSFASGFSSGGFGQWLISGIFALVGAIIQMGVLAAGNFSILFIPFAGIISFILFLLLIRMFSRRSSWGSSSSSSWSSSSSDSSWSSSSSDSFGGGGGSFGGGGASGDW